jgi:hypothetical protein
MTSNRDPSDLSWGKYLRNHMPHIAAMDLFVVPTISFNLRPGHCPAGPHQNGSSWSDSAKFPGRLITHRSSTSVTGRGTSDGSAKADHMAA